jgi:hypothetical protein
MLCNTLAELMVERLRHIIAMPVIMAAEEGDTS